MVRQKGCGLGSVTSESCVAERDKRKHDGEGGREGLNPLLRRPM